MAWRLLKRLVDVLQRGTLANDAADNKPYGSPDAVELAVGLAASLLERPTAGARELLSADVLRDLRALAARGEGGAGGAEAPQGSASKL